MCPAEPLALVLHIQLCLLATCRYGLYGTGLKQQADIDVLLEAVQDHIPKMFTVSSLGALQLYDPAFWGGN